MTSREKISRNGVVSAVAVVVLIVAAVMIVRSLSGQKHGAALRVYFTTDEGETLFVDSIDRTTPFDHDGKEAVRAHIFSNDGGKTHFVGYLEKTDPRAIKAMAEISKDGASPNAGPNFVLMVKRPGAANTRWIAQDEGGIYIDVIHNVKAPMGTSEGMEEVFP